MKEQVGIFNRDCGNIADGSFAALVVTPGVTLSDSSWVSTPSTAQDRKQQRCSWSWTIFSLSFQSNARSSFFENVPLENLALVMIYSLYYLTKNCWRCNLLMTLLGWCSVVAVDMVHSDDGCWLDQDIYNSTSSHNYEHLRNMGAGTGARCSD